MSLCSAHEPKIENYSSHTPFARLFLSSIAWRPLCLPETCLKSSVVGRQYDNTGEIRVSGNFVLGTWGQNGSFRVTHPTARLLLLTIAWIPLCLPEICLKNSVVGRQHDNKGEPNRKMPSTKPSSNILDTPVPTNSTLRLSLAAALSGLRRQVLSSGRVTCSWRWLSPPRLVFFSKLPTLIHLF